MTPARTPQLAAEATHEGWIEWSGGERPVGPQVRVRVLFRNYITGGAKAAKFYGWDHRPDAPGYDIIAYFIVGRAS